MNTGLIHNHVSVRARKRAAKWRLAGIIKINSGGIDCGYNAHAVALQFDHVGDDKKANVSNLIRSDYSWSTILEEIKKCEVRCANCHAVMTAHRKTVRTEPACHESDESAIHFDSLELSDHFEVIRFPELVPQF